MLDKALGTLFGARQSRFGFIAFWMASVLAGWFALRLVLFFSFGVAELPLATTLLVFVSGLHRDLYTVLLLGLPVLIWMASLPQHVFQARWHRVLLGAAFGLFWTATIFLLFTEYYFFEEFRSRFNTVAVDYLIYPHEVFINISDTYPVLRVLLVSMVLAAAWLLAAATLFKGMWTAQFPPGRRLIACLGPILLCAGLGSTIPLKGPDVTRERVLNEIANNGNLSFVSAAWTRQLDYPAFYKTTDRDGAYRRVRELLSDPRATFTETGHSIRRRINGDPAKPRLNVVLLLEESLGSEFWGSLGRKGPTLTPEMDKLAAEAGLLFTNIYASGNRTVRGIEGVLCSFPPLPGDSIVKRDRSDNVETLARVLRRDGYSTLFLYGGRGVFDGMRTFALANGFDRFIEQKHFSRPTFATIWGVCDEDLFSRTLQECIELSRQGKPFFVTALSVSNHKPFTYPRGRIPEDPDQRKRAHAVKYSDFALGQFFRAASQQSFWTNTIFVVVADHGARVYGSQSIPIESHAIPLLITGPAVVKSPARLGVLGCSTDVSPTVLGLIGRPYESMLFGQDLLNCSENRARAFLNHNRDIGMLAADRLVVLGLKQTEEFYARNPKLEMISLPHPDDSVRRLALDAICFYQVADDLYTNRRYRIDSK